MSVVQDQLEFGGRPGGDRGGVVEGAAGGSGSAAPGGLGLAMLHSSTLRVGSGVSDVKTGVEIDPGTFVLEVPEGGSVVRLRRVQGPRGTPLKLPKRGKIHGLSRGAASRCRHSMLALNRSRIGGAFFGCNSIPLIDGVPEFDLRDLGRFLKNWRQRFERRWPRAYGPSVKELTENGGPHVHFIIAWRPGEVPDLREFREWNDNAWAEVVRSSHPSHRQVACTVDVVRSWDAAVKYLAGYLTEGSSEDPRMEDSGKMWGHLGKRNRSYFCQWLPPMELFLAEGKVVQRTLLRLQRKKRDHWLRSAVSVRPGQVVEKWRRIRPGAKFKADEVDFAGIPVDPSLLSVHCGRFVPVSLGVEDQVRLFCSFGFRVKRVRPSCLRRVKVPLWSVDPEVGRMECSGKSTGKVYDYDKKLIVPGKDDFAVPCALGEEIHSFACSWHYVNSSEVMRLVAWVRSGRGDCPGGMYVSSDSTSKEKQTAGP